MANGRPIVIDNGVLKETTASSGTTITSGSSELVVTNPSDNVFQIAFDAELSKIPNLKLQFEAGETISALKVVRVDINGKAYVANSEGTYEQALVTGVALTSAVASGLVDVMLIGILTDNSWNWAGNTLLFLNVNGSIVSTAPTLGYSVRLGKALTPTTILIDVQEPIEL